MTELTATRLQTLKDHLTRRRQDLFAMIQVGTSDANHDNLRRITGEVADSGDESTALQQTDLNLAEMENEVRELRAIDRALERIKEGVYGQCIECGCRIPYARLEAYPTAERCTDCQTRYERLYGGRDVTPSL